jgi:phage baseplate assembly protein W
MVRILENIDAVNWQMSLDSFGEVVEGIADINQQIGLIVTTLRGSVPLLPEFGSDIPLFVDLPIRQAAPKIREEAFRALAQEPRIRVLDVVVTHEVPKPAKLCVRTRWTLADGVELGQNFGDQDFTGDPVEIEILI